MQMLIDDHWVDAFDGGVDVVLHKAAMQSLQRVPCAAPADLAAAVAAAQRGKRHMATLPAHERCAVLQRTADTIEARLDDLGAQLTREIPANCGPRCASSAATPRRPSGCSAA